MYWNTDMLLLAILITVICCAAWALHVYKPLLTIPNNNKAPYISTYDSIVNVDIVYMWVNGSDPLWQNATNQPLNSRNRDNHELKYSLRSIQQYLPWHRGHIYIVTPQQRPAWLKTTDRVTLVDQASLLPTIPTIPTTTANSFYIEAHLHTIPGLSENFIYLNDDYMFSSPTVPTDFFKFTSTGMVPVYYDTRNEIKYGFDKAIMYELSNAKVWLAATYYTNGALNDMHGNLASDAPPRFFMAHAPYALNRTHCRRVYAKYRSYIYRMRQHRTRHWKDVVFMLLYRYECPGYRGQKITKLLTITDDEKQNKQQYDAVMARPPFMFTVNDEFKQPATGEMLTVFLESYFPRQSLFEQ